ncbi:glycine/betaine ABC transporter substrate-binding protein [Gluconacetobacter azotocaptans]|uniref:glycine betaine ABC transporter substrate-binding protein n=1 Tax=Gluconacetobacter azotocaptans TaxID=142834 RepID=UPI001959D62F|nr:glycine betaine ABC transporter substrate-binding protein [Gluconacetobacter azotocaptans]MBM9400724.1 glycine/betaine ABC transporter substrate-binding protein [Gluconacetobacter azotocaptans]
MRRAIVLLSALMLCAACPAARAQDPAACRTVRLADVGWTDAAAVTAVGATLFDALGYQTRTPMLALTVAYLTMSTGQVDGFLSNWEPSGAAAIAPFLKNGTVRQIATNLSGAHYTLAVPEEVWQAGLHDFRDIAGWGSKLGHVIYGLEAGNDGNALVLDMIRDDRFGLGRFRLVESSEQGMLSQVSRSIESHRPIVFLAWEPHPMNMRFHLRYLTGGDEIFGPDAGASVHTVIRTGYDAACPNATRLLRQIRFSIAGENVMMKAIQDEHTHPRDEARRWLHDHPEVLGPWLDGVTTLDGRPGLPAVLSALSMPQTAQRP